MDFAALCCEVIRSVRGRQAQERVSQRLGFKSNVLYHWERGTRLPSTSDFFRLAVIRKPGVRTRLREFVGPGPWSERIWPARGSVDVASFLRWMVLERSAVDLAELVGVDRTTLGRWLRGKTEPRLPEFFRVVQATTQRLVEFVDVFAPAAQLAQVRDAHELLARQRRLAYERPLSQLVLHALELDGYKLLAAHESRWLARRLGTSLDQINAELHELSQADLIELVGQHFKPKQVMLIDTRADFVLNRRLKQYWAGLAAERAGRLEPQHRSLFSFNVFPISSSDFERLRSMHLDYYARVRELVTRAKGADHVVLVNVQLCALDEFAS